MRKFTPPKNNKTCLICNQLFLPKVGKQKYCDDCHIPCPMCNGKKDPRYKRCRKCDSLHKEGKPLGSRSRQTLKSLIDEIEVEYSTPDKSFAFGYVIGTALGDGCISKVTDKIKHTCLSNNISTYLREGYRVTLQTVTKEFALAFVSKWKVLVGREPKVREYTRTNFSFSSIINNPKPTKLFQTSPRHAKLGRYLYHIKYERPLMDLLSLNKETLNGILVGMIDSEGYVNPKKYIIISNKKLELLEICKHVLLSLGYSSKIYGKESTILQLQFRI